LDFQPLNLPLAHLKLTKKKSGNYVWCTLRKKYLRLSPEEWVRQHIIHFLISYKNFPSGLIASEYAIKYNELSRRCDLVVFDVLGVPKMIVECKSPEVALTEHVFHQIAHYNFTLNVDWLFVSNGIDHVICNIDRTKNQLVFVEQLPDWEALN